MNHRARIALSSASSVLLEALEDSRGTHAAADAHADQAVASVAAAHFVKDGGGEPGAGAAKRVAERDGATVDVEPVGVDGQLAEAGEHLRGECFVQLHQVDLV